MSNPIDDAISHKSFTLRGAEQDFFHLVTVKIAATIVDMWRANSCKITPALRIKMISALTVYLNDLPGQSPFFLKGQTFVQYASEVATIAIAQIASNGFTNNNSTILGWAQKVDEFRSNQVEAEKAASEPA